MSMQRWQLMQVCDVCVFLYSSVWIHVWCVYLGCACSGCVIVLMYLFCCKEFYRLSDRPRPARERNGHGALIAHDLPSMQTRRFAHCNVSATRSSFTRNDLTVAVRLLRATYAHKWADIILRLRSRVGVVHICAHRDCSRASYRTMAISMIMYVLDCKPSPTPQLFVYANERYSLCCTQGYGRLSAAAEGKLRVPRLGRR